MPGASDGPADHPASGGTTARRVAASLAGGALVAGTGLAGAPAHAPLPAQAVPTARVAGGTVGFDAGSTVGRFGGESAEVTGEVTGGGSPAAVRGRVSFPARSLRTGIGQRDRHMWESLESEQHPRIRFDLTGAEVRETRADTVVALVHGTLTVRGITRPVSSTVTAVPAAGGYDVRGSFPIDLRAWEVDGLRRMLGMLRVDPEVTVRFDLRMRADG